MTEISAEMVRLLREATNVSMMECKRALVEAGGDSAKATKLLRERGMAVAAKKAGRAANQGLLASATAEGGKVVSLVEVNCETDFVAKTDDFQAFAKDMAMQIAASNPSYVRREEVTPEVLEREKEIYRAQARDAKKPEKIMDKIVEGKLEKFYSEVCLLEQAFVKDPDVTVQDLLNGLIGKLGEKIEIRRFTRYQVGEGIAKS